MGWFAKPLAEKLHLEVRYRELDQPRDNALGVEIVLSNSGRTVILLRHSKRNPQGQLVLFSHLKVEQKNSGSTASVKVNEWDEIFWPVERGPFRNIPEFEAVMPGAELTLPYVLSFDSDVPDNVTLRIAFRAPSFDTDGSAEDLQLFQRPGGYEVNAKAYRHTPYEIVDLVVERTINEISAGGAVSGA